MTEYQRIDKSIKLLERLGIGDLGTSTDQLSHWIVDRIIWSYRWKKITKEQRDQLVDRMTRIFELSRVK